MVGALVAPLCSYLVGAIPTGYLIAQWCGIKDIRQHGSGNIGATNVARVLGVPYFFLIFFLDAVKAYGVLWSVSYVGLSDSLLVCAFALLLGNVFSIFLRFSGGKTISTLCGVLFFLSPVLLMLLFVVWLIVLVVTRRVGTASVASLSVLPFLQFIVAIPFGFSSTVGQGLKILRSFQVRGTPVFSLTQALFAPLTLFCFSAALLGLYAHRRNIRAILKGE